MARETANTTPSHTFHQLDCNATAHFPTGAAPRPPTTGRPRFPCWGRCHPRIAPIILPLSIEQMSTIRTHKQRHFSVLDNHPIEDMRLSWEALGVLTYLLSKPDDWRIQVQHLINLNRGAGRDKIYNILKNLEESGYLARLREQGADGKFTWVRELYESPEFNPYLTSPLPENPEMVPPSPEKPYTVLPYTAQPYTVKPTLLNTELPKTDPPITESPKTEGEDAAGHDAAQTHPPIPLEEEGDQILLLANTIAETCGLSPVSLAAMTGKGKAKWTEILGYAQQFASLTLPPDWCDHPAQAGPITADHIRLFRDWWQRTKPIGNSADDLPHPIQVFQRLSTRDAIAWITHRLPIPGQPEAPSIPCCTQQRPSPSTDPTDLQPNLPPATCPPQPATPASDLWQAVLSELQLSLERPVFDNWLRGTVGTALDGDTLTVSVPSQFAQEWLAQRMNGMIRLRVQRIAERPLTLNYQIAAHA